MYKPYWKTKSHIVHFILFVVSNILSNVATVVLFVDTALHITEEGYRNDLVLGFFVFSFAAGLFFFLLFIFDLIAFRNYRKRYLNQDVVNNIEVKCNPDNAEEFLKDRAVGSAKNLIVDVNKDNPNLEPPLKDYQYPYDHAKLSYFQCMKQILFMFGPGMIALSVMCILLAVCIGYIFYLLGGQFLIGFLIGIGFMLLMDLLTIFYVPFDRYKKVNKAAIAAKTLIQGVRIYKDHVENYAVDADGKGEIIFKVPFLKAKISDRGDLFQIKNMVNKQIVALYYRKDKIPSEITDLIKERRKEENKLLDSLS